MLVGELTRRSGAADELARSESGYPWGSGGRENESCRSLRGKQLSQESTEYYWCLVPREESVMSFGIADHRQVDDCIVRLQVYSVIMLMTVDLGYCWTRTVSIYGSPT